MREPPPTPATYPPEYPLPPGAEPPRKKRLDPLLVFLALGIALFAGIAWFFSRETEEVAPTGNLTAPVYMPETIDAGPEVKDTPKQALATADDPVLKKQPKSKKAKILQKELEKKRQLAQAMPADDGVNVVVSPGDGASNLAKIFLKKLKGVRLVASASRGYFITLRVDQKARGSKATVKCSAALSALPNKSLVASLASNVDVEGDGVPESELLHDATEACAADLAADVSTWIKRNR